MREVEKKVMQRAWEIKKEDARNIFSECLKIAWSEVKSENVTVVDLKSKKRTELIALMKEHHVKGWYRIYNKTEMITKLEAVLVA